MCVRQSCTRAAGRLFLSARGPNIIVCGLRGPEILAGLPAMTTETMFLTVTRYQLRNTYVNGTLLVSTYLCLQKLTPIKGFPKCLSIVSNLQSGPKIFMRLSCGQYKFRPACNSGVRTIPVLPKVVRLSDFSIKRSRVYMSAISNSVRTQCELRVRSQQSWECSRNFSLPNRMTTKASTS